MNVFQYAIEMFDLKGFAFEDEELQKNLESMPLDSNCGKDCEDAIARAAGLIISIRLARGEMSEDEATLISLTLDICQVFICG